MSDLLDIAPQLPRYGEGEDAILQGREPSRGEYLGASVQEGWWNSTPGAWGAMAAETRGAQQDATPMTREEWEGSGYARLLGPAWDERMTRGRAEAQARTYDDEAYRKALMAARDPSAFEAVLGFGAQMVGSIPDPVNFIPIGRGVELGLRGVGAIRAAEVMARPGVAASALRGAVDGIGGNALVAPAVYAVQERYGEEITFDKVLADLAIGAVIGAGFGTVGGLMSRRVHLDATTAVRTVDAAASDLAAGRPMEMPSSLATRGIEDAVMRAAPQEMVGVRLADLPAGANGAPMTRAEFDAWSAEAGRGVPEMAPEPPLAVREAPAPAEVAKAAASEPALSEMGQRRAAAVQDTIKEFDERMQAGDLQLGAPIALGRLEQWVGKEGGPTREQYAALEARMNGGAPAPQAGQNAGPDSLIPAGAERAAPDAPAMRGDGAAIEPAAAPAAILPTPETAAASREAIAADTYAWYREALDARRSIERMAAAPRAPESAAGKPASEQKQSVEQPGNSGLLPGPERQHIETMRAEGRLTAADEAILRAGDEQAAELQGVAKGLKEAGECLLRNMA